MRGEKGHVFSHTRHTQTGQSRSPRPERQSPPPSGPASSGGAVPCSQLSPRRPPLLPGTWSARPGARLAVRRCGRGACLRGWCPEGPLPSRQAQPPQRPAARAAPQAVPALLLLPPWRLHSCTVSNRNAHLPTGLGSVWPFRGTRSLAPSLAVPCAVPPAWARGCHVSVLTGAVDSPRGPVSITRRSRRRLASICARPAPSAAPRGRPPVPRHGARLSSAGRPSQRSHPGTSQALDRAAPDARARPPPTQGGPGHGLPRQAVPCGQGPASPLPARDPHSPPSAPETPRPWRGSPPTALRPLVRLAHPRVRSRRDPRSWQRGPSARCAGARVPLASPAGTVALSGWDRAGWARGLRCLRAGAAGRWGAGVPRAAARVPHVASASVTRCLPCGVSAEALFSRMNERLLGPFLATFSPPGRAKPSCHVVPSASRIAAAETTPRPGAARGPRGGEGCGARPGEAAARQCAPVGRGQQHGVPSLRVL